MNYTAYEEQVMERLRARNQNQPEFLQAVEEILADVREEIESNETYYQHNILERLTEPDRVISFLVCWEDDSGFPRVNRGWRVQHSNLIGPYKGGLRFHPSVNESVFKFLAFEQTFKNALTGLPIGGAKGGSDFNPRECSDREIMRFCQSFMNELYRHIGDKIDIPAGDINVGNREIGYLFGQYRRLANTFSGVLTGKDLDFGGSHVRLEATGFGLVYFVEKALARINQSIENKVIAVSGSGNVALHAALKSIQLGARVVTLSSSKGTLLLEDGFSEEDARTLITLKGDSTEKLKYLGKGEWLGGSTPWDIPCDIALPCATQNELRKENAECLVKNGCMLIAEGANMPCDNEALRIFEENRVQHVPGKASNAGGVALSALEMGQNASFSRRGFEELNNELRAIMTRIHELAVESDPNATDEYVNYRRGANIAAFKRVGHAMVLQGIGS